MSTRREKFTPYFKECEFQDPDTGEYSKDNHWKYSVRVVVDEDEADIYCQAITFFVGGPCRRKPTENGKIEITNRGYYINIGA